MRLFSSLFLILAVGAGLFFVSRRLGRLNPANSSSPVDPVKQERPVVSDNPFGIMPGSPTGMSVETKVAVAKDLGVSYYRTAAALFLDRWNGSCAECDAVKNAGLDLVLTVRNGGGGGNASNPPKDVALYRKVLGEVLDKYKPVVLVVENEENSMQLFYSGTPAEYHAELKIGCELAHARGIKCTNGGLVSSLVIGLVAENYRDLGKDSYADDFLNRALTPDKLKQLTSAPKKLEEQIIRGRELLAGYKAAGADYVNFHWYSDDPQALEEAVTYLETLTGLPAITNETGQQKNENPEQVKLIMQKVKDLGLPIAVWYSIDTPGYGEAKALTDNNGALRANGEAFKNFIKENY